MGRKTYESLPKYLRPLRNRISTVISRDAVAFWQNVVAADLAERKRNKKEDEQQITDALVSTSLESALEALDHHHASQLGNIFIIGGSEIYHHALQLGHDKKLRIIMTTIIKNKKQQDAGEEFFPCDTLFPLDANQLTLEYGWRLVSADELSGWVGEKVSSEWRDEGDVSIRIVGYERIGKEV